MTEELTILSQETVTRIIKRRLAHAANARRQPWLEDYPGESVDVEQHILAEAIGWASR